MKNKRIKQNKNLPIVSKQIAGPRVMLDSSFIVSILNSQDTNHKCTEALFRFIGPYNCRFHMPLYVYAEALSRLIQQGKTVAESLKIMDDFLNKIPGALIVGAGPTLKEIKERYKKIARKKIRLLRSNDFYIATEGILSGALILTCDYEMYLRTKKYYPDIFFIATHSKKYKNDIPIFTKRFISMV